MNEGKAQQEIAALHVDGHLSWLLVCQSNGGLHCEAWHVLKRCAIKVTGMGQVACHAGLKMRLWLRRHEGRGAEGGGDRCSHAGLVHPAAI